MVTHKEILETCEEHGIHIRDVDRLALNEHSYEAFLTKTKGTNLNPSNYSTRPSPAVRETDGEEKLVYVDEDGYEVEVLL